ncbi:MAG: hypothetical protein IT569_05595, partial [Leptospiraceae bacterium]|nr:hypothetical protein [Leptospiraceae bacterium]
MIANCVTGQPQCVFTTLSGTGTGTGSGTSSGTGTGTNATYLVGGTISGLVSGTLTLNLNSSTDLVIAAGGTSFQFSDVLSTGSNYTVTVKSNPSGSSCTVTNGTGTIASADISSVAITCITLSVSPFYSNGQNWNDYIKNDGTSIYSATNTACVGTESEYRGCFPAFFMKVFYITGKTSCTNISITDNLGLLSWGCVIAPNGTAAALSIGLGSGKGLADAIDFTNIQFKDITVTVTDNGATYMQTSPQKFWNNQVVNVNSGCVPSGVDTTGTIFAIPADTTCSATITIGLKRSVVMNSSVKAKMISSGATGMIIASDKFTWIEGIFDALSLPINQPAIKLLNSNFSRVHNTQIYNSNSDPSGNSGL